MGMVTSRSHVPAPAGAVRRPRHPPRTPSASCNPLSRTLSGLRVQSDRPDVQFLQLFDRPGDVHDRGDPDVLTAPAEAFAVAPSSGAACRACRITPSPRPRRPTAESRRHSADPRPRRAPGAAPGPRGSRPVPRRVGRAAPAVGRHALMEAALRHPVERHPVDRLDRNAQLLRPRDEGVHARSAPRTCTNRDARRPFSASATGLMPKIRT